MISVIIPVINEEKMIARVIKSCMQDKNVDEVIVVDDKSSDDTIREAQNAGANVITSTKIGKGASMRDGLLVSKNGIVVFLDGDIDYPEKTIEKLTEPIIKDSADFAKSTFSRQAGRVTELVAKPLLSLLFPDLAYYSQPLSGIIAGKRHFFEQIQFENDYGVDIGILIDMWRLKARIAEVNIGMIQNKMKMWRELGRMSREVSRSILKRLAYSAYLSLDSLGEINLIRDQMECAIKETLKTLKKMVVFDMDNTILQGRFIDVASKEFGFQKELFDIITRNNESYLITKLIARHMQGKDLAQLLKVADSIPLVEDTIEVIKELKARGYIVGIISDSYDIIANHIKMKVNADFSLANELEFSKSVATGEVKIPSFFMKNEKSGCNHNYCKGNALAFIAAKYDISLSNIIAIGDSEGDMCMIKNAGVGVSFCSNNQVLNAICDQRIDERRFNKLLEIAL